MLVIRLLSYWPYPRRHAHTCVLQVDIRQDEEDTEIHHQWQPAGRVYALGDCCADPDKPLPALAQVGGGQHARHQTRCCEKRRGVSPGRVEGPALPHSPPAHA